MTDLAKLIVKLEAQTAQYHAELQRSNAKLTAYQKQTNARLSAMTKGWQSFASGVKRALGFATVGLAVRAIFKATEDAQFAFAQLDAAVKSTGGAAGFTTPQLVEMSAALQKQSVFADENVQAMQAVLLQFRRISGPEFQAAQQAILDISQRLGKDLQSSAILVGKALNDPVKGMKALTRAGVQFTEEQTATIKKLVETNHLAEAQGVILAELNKQFGGAAIAARNTLGGALKALGNAFNDLLELSDESTGGVKDAVNDLTALLQDPATKNAIDSLFTGLIAGAKFAIEAIVGVTNTLREWFGLVSQAEKTERGIKIAMFLTGKTQEQVVTELRKQVDARLEFLKTALAAGKMDSGMALFFKAELANLTAARNAISEGLSKARDAHPMPTRASVLAGVPGSAPIDPEALQSIEDMTEKLQEQIATFDKGAVAVIRYRIEQGDLQEVFAKAGPTADALKAALINLTGQYERLGEAAKQAKEKEAARQQLDELVAGLQEEIALLGLGETAAIKYRIEHGKLAETFAAAGAGADALKQQIIDLTAALEAKQAAQKATEEAAAEEKSKQEDAAQIYEATRTAVERYATELQHLDELLAEKRINDETYNRAALQAKERFEEASKEINKFAEEATRNVQDILASFLEGLVTSGKVSFSSLLQDFSSMLIRMSAQAVAANIAGKLFGGGGVSSGGGFLSSIGGFVGGLFGGGAAAGAATGGGGASYGGGLAMGGDVRPGKAYRVGDAGRPEWLIPSTPGRVVPEKAMADLLQTISDRKERASPGRLAAATAGAHTAFGGAMASAVRALAPRAKAAAGMTSVGPPPAAQTAAAIREALGMDPAPRRGAAGQPGAAGAPGPVGAMRAALGMGSSPAGAREPTMAHTGASGAVSAIRSALGVAPGRESSEGQARAPGAAPGVVSGIRAVLAMGSHAKADPAISGSLAAAAKAAKSGGLRHAVMSPPGQAPIGALPGIPAPAAGMADLVASARKSTARLFDRAELDRSLPGRVSARPFASREAIRYGGNLAMGGDVRPGMGYRVGDAGKAEWLFPSTHGRVVPEKAVGGEKMTVHQNFTVSTPDGRVSKATQMQIASAAARGLAEATRRNG